MPPPRKIAYLLSQYPAVSHTFFLNEIAALRERGFLIETASINPIAPPDDGFSEREMAEAARTFCIKSLPKTSALKRLLSIALRHPMIVIRGLRQAAALSPGDLHGTLYAFFYLIEALLVGAWMRETGADHLHVHFGGPVATVALLVSAAWGIPYSITIHGPDELFDLEKFHLRTKMERARFVVCISHFCRSQLLRISPPAMWEKFHVCRLGVDETVFLPAARAEQGEPTTRLISVGRLNPSKGQAVLVQAIASLKQKGMRVKLDLIGGGVDRPHLESLIAQEGLKEDITVHGAASHAKTRALLQHGDIFVLPSFAEGVPVALMEAMAMEIACISTFVAGIPELIHPGTEGLLVAPSSVEQLSDAIAELVVNKDRRRTLALAGRAKVLEHYNLARNADRLAGIFASNLREGGSL